MKRLTKKEQREQAARDAKEQRLNKLGIHNSHFGLRHEDGTLWRSNIKMPYPTGFITDKGHWILSAWGLQGRALCGQTITFAEDHISHPQNKAKCMRDCCRMRLLRIQSRLGYRKLERQGEQWHWYVPTERLNRQEALCHSFL